MKILPLFLLAACQATPSKLSVPAEALQASVVKVNIFDVEDDSYGWCTAWYRGNDVWVTAAHCLHETYMLSVNNVVVDHLQPDPEGNDFGTFIFHTNAKPLPLAKRLPEVSLSCTRVHYYGFPGKPDGEPQEGVWEGCFNGVDADGDIAFSAWVDGGASGSPLMNEDGEVIGVVVSSYRGRPYSYAEPYLAP